MKPSTFFWSVLWIFNGINLIEMNPGPVKYGLIGIIICVGTIYIALLVLLWQARRNALKLAGPILSKGQQEKMWNDLKWRMQHPVYVDMPHREKSIN